MSRALWSLLGVSIVAFASLAPGGVAQAGPALDGRATSVLTVTLDASAEGTPTGGGVDNDVSCSGIAPFEVRCTRLGTIESTSISLRLSMASAGYWTVYARMFTGTGSRSIECTVLVVDTPLVCDKTGVGPMFVGQGYWFESGIHPLFATGLDPSLGTWSAGVDA